MPTDPRLRHIQWVAIKPGRPTGCGFFTLNANKWKRVDIVTTTLPLWWIWWRHTILFTVWLMLQIRWNSLECFKNNIALSVLKALANQQQFVTLPANKLANKSRMRLICTSVISVWFFFHNVLPPSPFFSDIKNMTREFVRLFHTFRSMRTTSAKHWDHKITDVAINSKSLW